MKLMTVNVYNGKAFIYVGNFQKNGLLLNIMIYFGVRSNNYKAKWLLSLNDDSMLI